MAVNVSQKLNSNIIDIYTARWRIEDFHKAWKTGAGAERQRMTEPRTYKERFDPWQYFRTLG
ncbi:hypothetical protein [Shewanella surugensis]|uniref:Transposase IS4-like domain-containing protein n=1 Tax=Shewanella surugensis TaxID=212020 RepID=A0ABT0LB17_9GAMM|nr:hypothetical protein [Shewanella surugensis]MCL1124892.1 hypothetical protein [Shewanella surugensis]